MKRAVIFSGLLACLASASTLHAQNSPALAGEKGKLRVMVNGAKVAQEEYSISANGRDWLATGSVQIDMPGSPSAKLTGRLTLNAQGQPQRYEWSLEEAGKKRSGSVQLEGSTANIEFRAEDSAVPFTEQFFFDSPHVVILDNNFYHHYAVLARLYDRNQKGKQTFRVYIPQDRTPGDVTVESLDEQEGIEHLRVRTIDLEIDLYMGKNGLVRLAVPAANVVVERE